MHMLIAWLLSCCIMTGAQAAIQVAVPQDVLTDYQRLVGTRPVDEIRDYSGDGARRDTIEMILFQQALRRGGVTDEIQFVPVDSYLRNLVEVEQGRLMATGTTVWAEDVQNSAARLSEPMIREGEYVVGFYTLAGNVRVENASLEQLMKMTVITNRAWKNDVATLESLGIAHIENAPTFAMIARMLNGGRGDFTTAILVYYIRRLQRLSTAPPHASPRPLWNCHSTRYTADMTAHPYEQLTPDLVLTAIDSTGCLTDGRLLALNSFENRVYQVGQEEGPPLIAKFYRPERWSTPAILEEHSFALALAAEEIPAVPPLQINEQTLFEHAGFRFALFRRQGGRTPEFDDPAILEWIGRFLARIHQVGTQENYQARLTLSCDEFGRAAQAAVLASQRLPMELEHGYRQATDLALTHIDACWQRAGTPVQLRLHGDCHPGNLLWTDSGPHFVDLDDSCMGPAMQDLWMLLGGDRQEMSQKLGDLLAGYETFRDFDLRELHLLEALRTLRMIHHAAWLARRWNDPAFPAAFPWFNTHAYWQEHIAQLHEQLERMNEAPLWSANSY